MKQLDLFDMPIDQIIRGMVRDANSLRMYRKKGADYISFTHRGIEVLKWYASSGSTPRVVNTKERLKEPPIWKITSFALFLVVCFLVGANPIWG